VQKLWTSTPYCGHQWKNQLFKPVTNPALSPLFAANGASGAVFHS
jgi:hypothetical protein